MNVISFSREDRELQNRIQELYDSCAAEKHAENAAKLQVYRGTNGLTTFSQAELTVIRPGSNLKPRHPKVEKYPLFARYNLCRAFDSGSYKRHINFALLENQSKSGIFVHRPRHPMQVDPTSSIIRIRRIFSRLSTNGNKGIVDNRGIANSLSSPYLSRCLPSEEDLGTSKIISARIEPKRGPGRPYGKYTPKKQSSAKVANTNSRESQEGQGINPPRENKKRGRKPSATTAQGSKQQRVTRTTKSKRSSQSTSGVGVDATSDDTTAMATTAIMNTAVDKDDEMVMKKTKTRTNSRTKKSRKNADVDERESDEEEEEEAEMSSSSSEGSMSMFEKFEVPEMPTSDLLPIIQNGGESTDDKEDIPNVFDISTLVRQK